MHNTFRLLNYSPRDCIQDTDDKNEQRQSTILDIERLEPFNHTLWLHHNKIEKIQNSTPASKG